MPETVVTMLDNLINPEVMADMVSAKVDKKIRILPYAKVDHTLQGNAGDTITIPKFTFIGDAVDVAEGEDIPVRGLNVTSEQYTVKKIGIGGSLTDEAVLSGHGNPVGELNNQMATSISSKCDNDALEELYRANTALVASNVMSYATIVNAVDLFNEEENSDKVIFVHPKQVTQLRLDPDFISKEKYGGEVMVKGEIGMVAGCRVVSSKKVKHFDSFYKMDSEGSVTVSDENLVTVKASLPNVKVGDKVTLVSTASYFNPIVKLEQDNETEDVSPAITVFLKRDTNIEKERITRSRKTEITGDKIYCVALTNESKVVICKTPAVATV